MGSNTYPNRTELIKAAFAGDDRVTFEDCKGSFDEPMIVVRVDGISGERWNRSGDGPYNKSADGIIARIRVALTPATAKPAQVVEAFTTWGDTGEPGSKPPTASVWETEANILRRQIAELRAEIERLAPDRKSSWFERLTDVPMVEKDINSSDRSTMIDPRLTPDRIAETIVRAKQESELSHMPWTQKHGETTLALIEEHARLSIKCATQDIEIFGLRGSEINMINTITAMRDNSKLLLTKYRSSMQTCNSRAERDHVRSMYEPEMLSALDQLIEKTSGL